MSPQSDIVRFAPALELEPRDVFVVELRIIQTLHFDLFVPTAFEFCHELVVRLQRRSSGALGVAMSADRPLALATQPLTALAQRFVTYLARDMTYLAACQSERACVAVHCALACWSQT
jgi:hypothetical protein